MNKPMFTKSFTISIHALREEGDESVQFQLSAFVFISIHALREEGDRVNHDLGDVPRKFLSTPSARRATYSIPGPIDHH